MIFTPASTSSSASGCAAAFGTARTPTTMSSSSTTRLEVASVAHRAVPTSGRPCAGSVSKIATTRKPWSAKMSLRRRSPAEVAGAEQRDVVLAGGPQDLADLRDERVDVVADAALAELAEAREVAADLRRVDVRVVAELLGGDRLLAHLLGLREDLQVAREPRGDAERQALRARAPSAAPRPRMRGVADAHRPGTLARSASRARGPARRRRSRTAPRRRARRPGCARGRRACSASSASMSTSSNGLAPTRSSTARASSQRWQPGRP